MAVPYHTHTFEIPTASKADVEAGTRDDVAATPAALGSAATKDVSYFATASQGGNADTAVQSVNGKTGTAITLDKSDIGLGSVDNTSDINKPVSTAMQAALDAKADATSLGTAAYSNTDAFATAAQGVKADSAVQPARLISTGTGLTGGGNLSADRTLALNAASIASLAKADSAVQPSRAVNAGAGLSGGGDLSTDRTLALNSASLSSLAKADTALQAPGGSTGQVLTKNSETDNDVSWQTVAAATAVSYAPQSLNSAQQAQARANIKAPTGDIRNVLINPLFSINQRSVSGTVTLTAGNYGHDRMKAGASGCIYTFSTNNGVTTINITSGSLQQIVEASCFAGRAGTYVLSWSGTAQGRIGAGSYGTSGNVSATCDGSANVTVEFSTGTLSLPQLERGYVTDFSTRHIQQDQAICLRYFQRISSIEMQAQPVTGNPIRCTTLLPSRLRSAPTITYMSSIGSGIVVTSSSIFDRLYFAAFPDATGVASVSAVFMDAEL
ncbi:hypothetical protein R5W60_04265 [Brucella pseudintermedia]|uniref:hypothetical protein n=1 Tax=Brucella pseudintermedia TaxID=370111 RepID=UPI00366F2C45|nr:hypothetical protein R5W60_04265 [Brucella pseudintermedia]